jgi:hypothetical protein
LKFLPKSSGFVEEKGGLKKDWSDGEEGKKRVNYEL